MAITKAASTQEERLQKQKRRSQRYHPLMEPMMLPERFLETVHRILGSYVHDLRSAISFLDQELDLPLVSLGFDLRLDREYGKKGEPDVDDARVTVTFHDGKNGPHCQRYTWAFAD